MITNVDDSNNVMVLFVISDTGIGMLKRKIDLVLDPEDLIYQELRRENIGVGLSLCKRTAEVMNAKLEIDSQIGKGTKIQFSVPFTIQSTSDV